MHEENWCEVIFKWVIWHTFESWQSVLWRRWENPTGTSHLPISILICKSSEKLLTLFPHEHKNSWFNQSCEEIFKDFFKWKSACIHFVQNWPHFSISEPATESECWLCVQWQLFSIMQQLSQFSWAQRQCKINKLPNNTKQGNRIDMCVSFSFFGLH